MAEVKVAETTDQNLDIIMPTLSLDEITEADPAIEEVAVQDVEQFRMQQFSESEVKQINDFAGKINFHDTNLVITYGTGAQKRLSDFSDTTLKHVRNKDFDEVGPLLTKLMVDLKDGPQEKKGIAGLFQKSASKVDAARAHYGKVESSIETISHALEQHQQKLLKDIAILDKLYENNKIYFKELTMYIAAGKIALKRAKEEELPKLQARAQETGLAEDAQEARDFASTIERFEKKLYDLDLTRAICIQNAPQIRMIQSNDVVLSDKIQTTLLNTIPLWKNQLVITLGLAHSKEAVAAQKMVTDTTNEILKKNAEMLHQGTVAIAKENERGIVDMETLTQTNEQLISTIDELMTIQDEGRKKRAEAEVELANIENKLKQKMLEASRR